MTAHRVTLDRVENGWTLYVHYVDGSQVTYVAATWTEAVQRLDAVAWGPARALPEHPWG